MTGPSQKVKDKPDTRAGT